MLSGFRPAVATEANAVYVSQAADKYRHFLVRVIE
jgi:hypothetical protein